MADKPFEVKDRFGIPWVVKPKTVGNVTGYDVQLLGPEVAYGTQPQQTVIVTTTTSTIAAEIDAYVNDFLASGGTPPKRAGDIVVTGDRGGAWILLALLALVMMKGKRR